MSELNLKQISDRLNSEFAGEPRKLVFWYDEKAEFAEDINSLELENVSILHLKPDTQFQTKYFLECEDTETNYLIYAPFPKPEARENHLEDTLLYSKRLFADRATLLCLDLGIDPQYKYTVEKHIKFFANKERTQRFYDLEIEQYDNERIELGLMCAICRAKICSFEEVLRILLTEDDLSDSKYLLEFDKYDLLPSFWEFCEEQFGYFDEKPTLQKLVVSMFVTYAVKCILRETPIAWRPYLSNKSGNIIAFLDNLMNHLLYRERFDTLSAQVATTLKVSATFQGYNPETLVECDIFAVIDQIIIEWVTERLLAEDTGARLGAYTIPELCEKRKKMHFGGKFGDTYDLLISAQKLIVAAKYRCDGDFNKVFTQYYYSDWMLDNQYRNFYYCYDKLDSITYFESLRKLVENIYTNEYMGKLLPKWNEGILEPDALGKIPLQRDFFRRYIKNSKEHTVVIISDAMRYEVGQALSLYLANDPKCNVKAEAMLSVLPSYTRLGMAALLPHKTLELTDDGKELVDGVYCTDLASRQSVLQSYIPNSCCVQFDEIKNMKKDALRELFAGKQVVYVYHDQIDVRGEHAEDEVFIACEEGMAEIGDLIRRISGHISIRRFIITADHGFLYKREKLKESDKIGGVADKNSIVKRRYIVSKKPVMDDGICHLNLGYILGNDDDKIVSFPCSTSVFKVPGNGGLHYVHGGSSPQEMIVPVIEVKTERGKMETRPAQIKLVSLVQKITNLVTVLDFIQSEPISDVVKETSFRLFFVSENNERISNENIYVADKRDEDAQKRVFRLHFTFKNQKYDTKKHYYLVAYDQNSDMEVFRHAVIMDLAFADDFGFGI